MATAGGVTQAIYPEGGLSLNGLLQPPKMGLLSYVTEGFDPDAERDVVFVPVAINYDRVLEDRVLIAADARGDRRFGARITVVVGFILRKFWQRLRGKDTRFGTAAVAFGTPLSLRDAGPETKLEDLSVTLMNRISDAMPVMTVPLVAQIMLAKKSVSRDQLLDAVGSLLRQIPTKNRVPQLATLEVEVDRALLGLESRGIVSKLEDVWQIDAAQAPVLQFYANSIQQFMPDNAAVAK